MITVDPVLGAGDTVNVFSDVSVILARSVIVPSIKTSIEPLMYFFVVEKVPVPVLLYFSVSGIIE